MLVLTRTLGERIIINDDVVVTVLSVKGNKIKIGIEAPGDVPVHREEVHARIHQDE